MSSLAQMERDLTVERTKAGLEPARRQGCNGGRKRKMNDSKIAAAKRLLQDATSPWEVIINPSVIYSNTILLGITDTTDYF